MLFLLSRKNILYCGILGYRSIVVMVMFVVFLVVFVFFMLLMFVVPVMSVFVEVVFIFVFDASVGADRATRRKARCDT